MSDIKDTIKDQVTKDRVVLYMKGTPQFPQCGFSATAAEILKRAVRLLSETKGEAWVNKGATWHMIKRLDPTFDTKDHGHASFVEMVKAESRSPATAARVLWEANW